jgi:hypothetical protein
MTTKPGLKFSVAAIDSAKEILKALPPAPRETKEVSLREAIEELAPTIRGLLAKGYSRQQVVDLIQEQGVGCSLTSLKTYFRRSPEDKSEVLGGVDGGTGGGISGDRSGGLAAGDQRRLRRSRSGNQCGASGRNIGASSVAARPNGRRPSRRGTGGHRCNSPSGSEGVLTVNRTSKAPRPEGSRSRRSYVAPATSM